MADKKLTNPKKPNSTKRGFTTFVPTLLIVDA